MTNNLEIITEALHDRDDIRVAHVHNKVFLNPTGFDEIPGQDVTFSVAPIEPIYKAKQLNELSQSLVPGLEPSYETQTRKLTFGGLILGRQEFDEPVGKIKVRGVFEFDPENPPIVINDQLGFAFEAVIERFITVRLFPDVLLAKEYGNQQGQGKTVTTAYWGQRELRKAKIAYRQQSEPGVIALNA